MKISFNKSFWFGTSTSGPQSEGWKNKKNDNIMDTWFKEKPEDFFDTVGPDIASDVYSKYKEDVEIMSKIKLNSFRTSIQWSRLIDNFDSQEVNLDAVKFYRDYFQQLKDKNITLMVNLYHFDMPQILQDRGGWENKEVVDLFVKYATKCFELFGDLVNYWATFNEPVVPAEAGYMYKWHYPFISNLKRAIQVGYNTILAHSKTVKVFHELFKNDLSKKISIILNLTPCYPKTNSEEDIKAAHIVDLFFNKSFLDPIIRGKFPIDFVKLLKTENLLPECNREELKIIRQNTIDILAVNYYQPRRAQARSTELSGTLMPEKWFETYTWPKARINPYRGWEIYPKTIYDIAMDIKNNYNNFPWFISENGMGVQGEEKFIKDGIVKDQYRIDFIKEHLYWLNKAISHGSNCLGYQIWTFVDCWSWNNAYKNRYGLVSLDLKTQRRTIKESGYWMQKMISYGNMFELTKEEVEKYESVE